MTQLLPSGLTGIGIAFSRGLRYDYFHLATVLCGPGRRASDAVQLEEQDEF
jgi:hypothetical protein